jgi:chemotaxis protein CheD
VNIVIGVSDLKVSNDVESTLVTYSLGSCIGISVYDPVAHVGGMLHFMLPDSGLDRVKSRENPYMFADTGIPPLFKKSYNLGAKKHRMKVIVVGGAQVHDQNGIFNIGKRNYLAVRQILWKNNVMIDYEDVGGNANRTVKLAIKTGQVWLKIPGQGVREV